MRAASSPRRVAGLLAVTTIGLSTAVLSAPTSAQAMVFAFGTTGTTATQTVTVPADICAIQWTIAGAAGGAGEGDPPAEYGEQRTITTTVTAGDQFVLAAGAPGDSWQDGGAGGMNPADTEAGEGVNYFGGSGPGTSAGGGGGAASAVLKGGAVYLAANGGAGGGEGGGISGRAMEAGIATVVPNSQQTLVAGQRDGIVRGEGIACEGTPTGVLTPPGAPTGLQVTPTSRAGELGVWFTPPAGPAPGSNVAGVTGYQYSLDGGSWTAVQTMSLAGSRMFTLTGLRDGQTYSVKLRATSSEGPGAESAAATGRPFTLTGAPKDVVVTTGAASLTVTWAPPTAGTFPIVGYEITAIHGDESNGFEVPICKTDAAARTCTATVPVGVDYAVYVHALDAEGILSHYGVATSGVVPFAATPATVPAADGVLLGSAGSSIEKVTAGREVVLRGSGYAPNSTVRIVAYSTPTPITTVVTDANGSFEVTVTIPAGLAPGEHSLVATGIDADGNERTLRVDVTVSAAGTPSITQAAELPYSGAAVVGPAIAGLVAVGLGGGLLVATRRRRSAD